MGNCLPLLSVLSTPDPAIAKAAESLLLDATTGKKKTEIDSGNTKRSSSCSHSRSRPHVRVLGGDAGAARLKDFYEIGAEIGRGQFGVIRRCLHKASGKPFACKTIAYASMRTETERQSVRREVAALQSLRHSARSNVVRLEEVLEDTAGVHMVMELCEGGDLYDRIVEKQSFSEAEAAPLLKSLMEALHYCHSSGVMHRDLKPENILLTKSGAIKLADFGVAIPFTPGQRFRGRVGSPYYVAPEVLTGEYSVEIDVWSAGVILYILLSGEPPFWGNTDSLIVEAVRRGKLHFPKEPWARISPSAKDLIRGMLCTDVHTRLTPSQILKHSWIWNHCAVNSAPECSLTSPCIQMEEEEEKSSSANGGKFESPWVQEKSAAAEEKEEAEAMACSSNIGMMMIMKKSFQRCGILHHHHQHHHHNNLVC